MNVAITLGRLGTAVGLLTAVGSDERGLRLKEHLRASHVSVIPGSFDLARTSVAAARLREDGSAHYEFDLAWAPSGRALAEAPATPVTHAGSLALFLEPGASAVEELLQVRSVASLITLDPNIRASLIGSRSYARARLERLLPFTHVVKLSDEDASWLYPDREVEDTVRYLGSRGPRLVVLTCGAAGAVLQSGVHQAAIAPVPVRVADTIGAGDSFMGALLHVLSREPGAAELLRAGGELTENLLYRVGTFAAKVAALTVGRVGADPPRLGEIEWTAPGC